MGNNELINKFIKTTSDKLEEAKSLNPLFIHIEDEKETNLYAGNTKVTDVYNSQAEDDWKTIAIGGVEKDTMASELKGKSVSEILDMILYKVEKPTHTNNSVSLTYNGPKRIEVGTRLPSESDFKVVVDRGKWSDGTPYAGEYGISFGVENGKFGQPSTEGICNIKCNVEFSKGETPKDNRGNAADVQVYNGGTLSKTVSITSVCPVYVNADDINEMKKYVWNYISGSTEHVVVPPESEEFHAKFMISVPTSVNIIVKQYNPLTKEYDIDAEMEELEEFENEPYGEYKTLVRFGSNIKTSEVHYEIKLNR